MLIFFCSGFLAGWGNHLCPMPLIRFPVKAHLLSLCVWSISPAYFVWSVCCWWSCILPVLSSEKIIFECVCDCLGSRSVVCRSDISMKFVASCHLLSNLFFTLNFYRLLFAWCMNYPSLCCTSCCFFHNLFFACLFLSFSVINCLASFFSLNHSFPLGFPIVSLPVLHHLISPSLPSSIIFCLSFPSPSLLISTSDEHWEVDSLASMCSHFMVWLKNWEKRGKKGKSGRDAILERIIERAKVSTAKVEIQKRGGLKWESGRNREKVKEDICFWTLPVHDGKPIQKQRLYHCLQYAHFLLTKRHLPLSCFGSLFVSRSLIKGQHHLLHTVFMVLLMCLFLYPPSKSADQWSKKLVIHELITVQENRPWAL